MSHEMSDTILKADKFQQHSEDAEHCPVHGVKLWAHKSGSALLCPQKECPEGAAITSEMLDAGEKF